MGFDNRVLSRDAVIASIKETYEVAGTYQLQLIKIKNMHRFNAIYGYEVGDIIVKEFYLVLKKSIAELDPSAKLFHLKGSTFITISKCYLLSELSKHGHLIYQLIDQAMIGILKKTDLVRCSVAVIPIEKKSESIPDRILANIEYYLSQNDSNSTDISKYDNTFFEKLIRQSSIITRLENALENKDIKFHFQPQYDKSNNIVGFESLARWEDDELGIITPNEFIPAYENSPLCDKFCYYTIENVLNNFYKLNKYDEKFTISINLMKSVFEDEKLPYHLKKIATYNNIEPSKIILEITETDFSRSNSNINYNLKNLRNLGFKLSIDDFGTGDASYAKLINLEFDELKLDMSFTKVINTENLDEKANQFITSICKLCINSGINIVFEGIETQEQRDFVFNQLGVNIVQGFYYSKALPIDKLTEKLVSTP